MENLPGHALPIDFDYSIEVKTWNALNASVVTVRALTMLPDGTIQKHSFVHNPVTVQNTVTSRHKIDSGFLIAVSVHTDVATIFPGELFCTVSLVRGELASPGASLALIAGYISRGITLSWPTVAPKGINQDPMEPLYKTASNPAAGANLAIDGLARVIWKPIAVKFVLTTDVNAANRRMILQIGAGGADFAEIIAQTVQTASLAWTYYFTIGAQLDQLTGTKYTLGLPEIDLPSLATIYTAIENKQAGDQISSVRYIVGTRLQGTT